MLLESWREVNVLIAPQRGKKGGVWELMTAELHIDLDKELKTT